MVRHIIGELPGVLQVHHELRDLGLDVADAVLDDVAELLLELAEGGLEGRLVADRHVERLGLGFNEFAVRIVRHAHPRKRLHEHLHGAVGVTLHPQDVAGCADGEEVVAGRFFDVAVALADDQDGAVAVQSRVDGANRHAPARVDGHDHRRIQDRAAHRADGDGAV